MCIVQCAFDLMILLGCFKYFCAIGWTGLIVQYYQIYIFILTCAIKNSAALRKISYDGETDFSVDYWEAAKKGLFLVAGTLKGGGG